MYIIVNARGWDTGYSCYEVLTNIRCQHRGGPTTSGGKTALGMSSIQESGEGIGGASTVVKDQSGEIIPIVPHDMLNHPG